MSLLFVDILKEFLINRGNNKLDDWSSTNPGQTKNKAEIENFSRIGIILKLFLKPSSKVTRRVGFLIFSLLSINLKNWSGLTKLHSL